MADILQMIRVLAGIVGCEVKGQALAVELERGLEDIRDAAQRFPSRPRVFFEEWDNPLISGIQWVEELVEIAGGDPIFPELRQKRLAKDRIIQQDEALRRKPDVILASWCGKKMKKSTIVSRPGWDGLPAVQTRSHLRHTLDLHPAAGTCRADRRRAADLRAPGVDVF